MLKDHGNIVAICRCLRAKWETVGLTLRVQKSTLDAIRHDRRGSECSECLSDMLAAWIKKDNEEQPHPTIRTLCYAFYTIPVDTSVTVKLLQSCCCGFKGISWKLSSAGLEQENSYYQYYLQGNHEL